MIWSQMDWLVEVRQYMEKERLRSTNQALKEWNFAERS